MQRFTIVLVILASSLQSPFVLAQVESPATISTKLVPGETTSFTANGETGITYHAYAPLSFKANSTPPLLVAFSPGGNGKQLIEKLKAAVTESGWLLVGCDVLRNNMKDDDLSLKMEDEVLDDIFRTMPHDMNRVYLGGFSGGGWRAFHLTERRKEPFAGVLSFGGWLGGASSQDEPYRKGMSVAMVNGLNDKGANGWMPIDTASLRKRNCTVKHFAFQGGHRIAPPEVTASAIAWLDKQWIENSTDTPKNAGKQPLEVLYVGAPGKRADDFTSFLSRHFQTVRHITPAECTLEQANAADVLLLDAIVRTLPDRCTTAMVMLGSSAAMTGERYGSKIDWLCQCLDNEAYHVDTTHPIFEGPIKVKPTLTAKQCPHAKLEIMAWKVEKQQDTPGLVSSRRFFEQAADSEIISGGVNMKGIHGVALVREAHRLLWGFIAPPGDMTEEARKVFVNALVWIHRFDGHQQTDFAGMTPRSQIQSVLDSPYTDSGNLMRWFPRELLEQTDNDKKKIGAHFEGRLPYVHAPQGSGQLEIDEAAERLKTPNSDVESLVKWVAMLDGDQGDIAKRLLQRYTGRRFRKPKQWGVWLEQNKDQLQFLDERGYRFYHNEAKGKPTSAKSKASNSDDTTAKLTNIAPVQFDCTLEGTQRINGNDYQFQRRKVTLVIQARVKEGWFFYPPSSDNAEAVTLIEVTLPQGMTFVDDWKNPKPTDGKLLDGAVFRRMVHVGKPSSEQHTIDGALSFQACTKNKCLPRQQLKFRLPLRVIPR